MEKNACLSLWPLASFPDTSLNMISFRLFDAL